MRRLNRRPQRTANRQSRAGAWIVLLGLLLVAACKPGTPQQYIQPDDMEDILVDYHLAKALAQLSSVPREDRDIDQTVYIEAALQKHGVTKADFDSSLIYYYTRADRFEAVYRRVNERLEEMALVQGATEGEIGKYAQLDATGDTANIWADRPRMALMPQPPYNRWDFTIEGDSTFRRGDSFLMQFMTDFMYQSGQKSGVLYVAVEYTDTVVGHNLHFASSGLNQLNIRANDKRDIKRLRGFFYLGNPGEQKPAARLLFLSSVQLIRFHKEIEHEPEHTSDSIATDSIAAVEADSLQRDATARRLATDTLRRRDSVGVRDLILPLDTGTAPHRVAARPRLRETR